MYSAEGSSVYFDEVAAHTVHPKANAWLARLQTVSAKDTR